MMSMDKRDRLAKKAGIENRIVIVFFVILNLIVLNYYSVTLADTLKFLAAVFLCTFIPGLVLVNIIAAEYKDSIYKFALALVIGIVLDIFLYILFSALNIKLLLYPAFGLLFFVYLKGSWLKYDKALLKKWLKRPLDKYLACFVLLGVWVLVLTTKMYFIPNVLPGQGDVIYSVDYPWHIGNIAEIAHNWPPQDPRLAGFPFHYHIFFYVFAALLSYITGIPTAVVFFRLSVLFLFYLILIGAYFTGSRWYEKKSLGLINAVIFVLAGTAMLSHPSNIFLKNLFFSPTFLLASVIFLFLLLSIKEYFENKGSIILILMLVFALSGAKGSFFPVIFAGLFLTGFYMVWRNKDELKRVAVLLSGSLIVFLLVYFYIYGLTPGGEGINLFPLEIIYTTWFYKVVASYWGENNFLGQLLFIPLYLFLFFSFRLLAYIDWIQEVVKVRNISPGQLFLVSTVLISLIPAYLLSYRGTSQYYFLFVGYICLNLMAAAYIYKTLKGEKGGKIKFIVIALLFISVADTFGMINETSRINDKLAALNSKPLTEGLYEGLVFLRDNTEKDAVIAARRTFLLAPDNARFFYYSAFAERRILVEGWQYMSLNRQKEAEKRYDDMTVLYFTHDKKTAAGILNKYEIDYLIIDKKAKQRLRFDTEGLLAKCFENSEVIIWKVLK